MKPQFDVLEPRDCPAVFTRIPAVVDWAAGLTYGVMGNDRLGDCGAAVAGHIEQTWNARARHPWTPSDADVQTFYYQTSVNHQDLGAFTYSTIAGWASWGVAGHRISRFAALNWFNHQRLRNAVFVTEGGVYLGVNLPATAIDQFRAGQPWTTVTTTGDGAPGSGGTHAIELTGYNSYNDTFTAVTWGREIVVTGDWINHYTQEAWAVAGGDMFGPGGRAGNGMTMRQINASLNTLWRA